MSGTAGTAEDELLTSAVALARRAFGAAACSVALLDDDGEHLVFVAAEGDGASEVVGLRLPVSLGIAGWAVSSGQPIAVDQVQRDPRFARDVAESTGYVPRTILAAPLETADSVLGVIEVLDRTPVAQRDDLGLLSLVAHQLALGLQLSRRTSELSSGAGPGGELAGALADLGPSEQRTALDLVQVFVDHVRRSGGPSRVV